MNPLLHNNPFYQKGHPNFWRRFSLAAFILLLSVLQNTPGLFPTFFGSKAYLLVPAVVSIALYEKDMGGIFFGLFAGALWDIYTPGGDLHAIFLVITGFAAGSLLNNLMRANILTNTILSAAATATFVTADWLRRYILGGLDSAAAFLLRYYLPSFIFTLALSPAVFAVVFFIEQAFTKDTSVHENLEKTDFAN